MAELTRRYGRRWFFTITVVVALAAKCGLRGVWANRLSWPRRFEQLETPLLRSTGDRGITLSFRRLNRSFAHLNLGILEKLRLSRGVPRAQAIELVLMPLRRLTRTNFLNTEPESLLLNL